MAEQKFSKTDAEKPRRSIWRLVKWNVVVLENHFLISKKCRRQPDPGRLPL